MKNKRIPVLLLFLICLMLLFIAGCSSNQQFIRDRGEHWLAASVDDLKQDIAGTDSYATKHNLKVGTYPMADGYYGLEEPVDNNCVIQWKINPRHKVVGYNPKGSGCDLRTDKDMELYNLKQTTTQSDRW
jgi:hypothetical protein